MYAMAHVIVGTYLPMEGSLVSEIEDAADADIRDVMGSEPWTGLYHGGIGNSCAVGFAGVEIAAFDETTEFQWHTLAHQVETALANPDTMTRAKQLYRKLPKRIRDLLPEFGVHVIWASS